MAGENLGVWVLTLNQGVVLANFDNLENMNTGIFF